MYKTIRYHKPAVFSIFVIVALLMIVIAVDSKSLSEKNNALAQREQELTEQLEYEQKRAEELVEFEKYTKTKKYAEEMAKKKLGLVHDNEIIFKSPK
ncbi:MAG: septum formation initiator family protein [Lachnospiraceae bacterium]|nr:septum formation initiator family protein [Lachnospiraceae bacterium]